MSLTAPVIHPSLLKLHLESFLLKVKQILHAAQSPSSCMQTVKCRLPDFYFLLKMSEHSPDKYKNTKGSVQIYMRF
uniref:Uncharacterized protein n=1 Tax=Anguilla anguilla TaxID=7936 RepID=A0A0E9QZH2_ANGAN